MLRVHAEFNVKDPQDFLFVFDLVFDFSFIEQKWIEVKYRLVLFPFDMIKKLTYFVYEVIA